MSRARHPARNQEIVGLRERGAQPIDIARRLGISRNAVNSVLRRAGLTAPGRRARGEERGSAKLTEADVREARALRAAGDTWLYLAARYGVAERTIRAACAGDRWGHVQ